MTAFIFLEEIPEPGGSMLSRPEKLFHRYATSIEKAKEWMTTMKNNFNTKKDQVFFYITIETCLDNQDLATYVPENYTKMYMHGLVRK